MAIDYCRFELLVLDWCRYVVGIEALISFHGNLISNCQVKVCIWLYIGAVGADRGTLESHLPVLRY